MTGVREIDRFLQQWQMGVKDLHRRMILAPTPRGALVRHLAAGPRRDGIGDGAGPGTGPSYHRTMGFGLWGGWSRSLDLRADRGFPSALGKTQQAELRAALQESPAKSGIGLANWTLRQAQGEVGAAVSLGTMHCQPVP